MMSIELTPDSLALKASKNPLIVKLRNANWYYTFGDSEAKSEDTLMLDVERGLLVQNKRFYWIDHVQNELTQDNEFLNKFKAACEAKNIDEKTALSTNITEALKEEISDIISSLLNAKTKQAIFDRFLMSEFEHANLADLKNFYLQELSGVQKFITQNFSETHDGLIPPPLSEYKVNLLKNKQGNIALKATTFNIQVCEKLEEGHKLRQGESTTKYEFTPQGPKLIYIKASDQEIANLITGELPYHNNKTYINLKRTAFMTPQKILARKIVQGVNAITRALFNADLFDTAFIRKQDEAKSLLKVIKASMNSLREKLKDKNHRQAAIEELKTYCLLAKVDLLRSRQFRRWLRDSATDDEKNTIKQALCGDHKKLTRHFERICKRKQPRQSVERILMKVLTGKSPDNKSQRKTQDQKDQKDSVVEKKPVGDVQELPKSSNPTLIGSMTPTMARNR